MTTAAQVAKAALQRILVQGSEAPLEADEYADFIFDMNNFMASLKARGTDLGYTDVTNVGDTITIDAGAIDGLVANMAIRVAPDYGGEISQGLVVAAKDGMNAMRRLGRTIVAVEYPDTLPRGGGNDIDASTLDRFYDGAD